MSTGDSNTTAPTDVHMENVAVAPAAAPVDGAAGNEDSGGTGLSDEVADSVAGTSQEQDSETVQLSSQQSENDDSKTAVTTNTGDGKPIAESSTQPVPESPSVHDTVDQPSKPPVAVGPPSNDESAQADPTNISSNNEIGASNDTPPMAAPPSPPRPKKHPDMERTVEQSKVLPGTGQYYPLYGTIVDYLEEDGRIPPRFLVRYHHSAPEEGFTDGLEKSANGKSTDGAEPSKTVIMQDDWVTEDLASFDAAVQEGSNPVAVYNRYTTTSNRIKSQSPGLKLSLANVEQRYGLSVEHTYSDYERILSTLILMAALEESLHGSLQRHLESQQQEGQEGNTSRRGASPVVDAPKYYTTNPTVYLIDPSKHRQVSSGDDANNNENNDGRVQMTPTMLAQRVRQGCQWAWSYLQAKQQPPLLLPPPIPIQPVTTQEDAAAAAAAAAEAAGPTDRRRSSRAAAAVATKQTASMLLDTPVAAPRRAAATRSAHVQVIHPVPTPVQRGGRVALWWLHTLQNGGTPLDGDGEEEEEVEEDDMEEEKKAEEEHNVQKGKTEDVVDSKRTKKAIEADNEMAQTDSYDMTEDDEDDEKSDDRDEDYDEEDNEDNEDDELEGVSKERGRLSPVPAVKRKKRKSVANGEDDMADNSGSDSEEGEEDEEEEIDEEHEIVYSNPYLRPSLTALLETLAHSKAISMDDVQNAMKDVTMRVRHNKRFAEFGLVPSNLPLCDQVAVEMENPDSPMSGSLVLKCVSGDNFSELQRYDVNTFGRCRFEIDVIGETEAAVQVQRREAQIKREEEYREQKAWDRWRYRGIQEGYCDWPTWMDSAETWVNENVPKDNLGNDETKTNDISEAGADDEALARSMEASEAAEPSGRRRNMRRAAASATDGVFYGNQSSLSLKQLVDALRRLIKSSTCQTLMKLISSVGDDSSDPLRRCRNSIGKMIWKRNLIAKTAVTSTASDATVRTPLESGEKLVSTVSAEDRTSTLSAQDLDDLSAYIHNLHLTEVYLREMVLDHIGIVPVPIIACAADERHGSMENMDRSDFEDASNVEWMTSGNELVGKYIYRPTAEWVLSTDATECIWYKIQGYSESIESDADDAEDDAVERRMRFQAEPALGPDEELSYEGETLLLTEAQVRAGLAAAKIQLKRDEKTPGHVFASSSRKREKVKLVPVKTDENSSSAGKEIYGQIVGHDTVMDSSHQSSLQDRILVLPSQTKQENQQRSAFWATLGVGVDGSSVCTPENESIVYTIENSSYGPDSDAYLACQDVLEWLSEHPKIDPFLHPVDPVALGIPTYFDVIKHPMDLSTVREKLENGIYSTFSPSESRGKRFPLSLMLNGPFRDDVELMCDNAMTFNPPDDWIHKAGKSLKQGFLRRIRDIASKAESRAIRTGALNSLYMDEDSDFDADDDDEGYGSRGGRKRKRGGRTPGAIKDEPAGKTLEYPIRLQKSLRAGGDLRGPFARLPINTDANTFLLPSDWSCRWADSDGALLEDSCIEGDETGTKVLKNSQHENELERLLSLHQAVSENEMSRLRRSTRAAHDRTARSNQVQSEKFEYFLRTEDDKKSSSPTESQTKLASRFDVEVFSESQHEEYYSKMYQLSEKDFFVADRYGKYSPGSFPPYLGRVVPEREGREGIWEIRSPFVVPALRWVLRGLIKSGHLTALEPMTSDPNSGLIIANDIYYYDPRLNPFEVLDTKELQRRKRSDAPEGDDSEDDVELSEYEKLRAERMARNQERLKMLGLA